MELVRTIGKDKKHKKTPVIIVRYWPSDHAELLRHTLDGLKKIKAVNAYIEANSDDVRPFGERVREAVEKQLPVKKHATPLSN
jgi:hypothetical protein